MTGFKTALEDYSHARVLGELVMAVYEQAFGTARMHLFRRPDLQSVINEW